MKSMFTNLRSPALISFMLILPFMVMELVNRQEFKDGFPVVLFGVMWLLPLIFILLLMPVVRNVRAGNAILARPVSLFISVVLMIFIAVVWIGAVMDQMPCFLGVPNCD